MSETTLVPSTATATSPSLAGPLAGTRALPAAGLVALVAFTFAPALPGPFVLDDELLVLDSRGAAVASPFEFFREPVSASLPGGMPNLYYRPLSFTSLWLDRWLWDEWAPGFRVTSLLLHAASAVLLFVLARQRGWVGSEAAAFSLAAIWAVLPVHAETVGYIAARHDVLFLALYLGALVVWSGAHRPWRLAVFALLALGAFLAKEMAISLPVAALILDAASGGPTCRRARAARWITGVATLALLFAVRAAAVAGSDGEESGTGAGVDLRLIGSVVWHYAAVLASPFAYSIDRSRDVDVDATSAALGATVLIAAIAIVAWRARRAGRLATAAAGLLWAAVAYGPVSHVIPLYTLAADRYLYLPLVGLAVAIGAALANGGSERDSLPRPRSGRGPSIRTAAAAATILLVGGLTAYRAGLFADAARLYEHSLETSPRSPMLHNNYGRLLAERRPDLAAGHFGTALAIAPGYQEARFNLGVIAREGGDIALAESCLAAYVESRPGDHQGWYQYGLAALGGARFEEARRRLEVAEGLRPGDPGVRYHLAVAHTRAGSIDVARELLRTIADDPDGGASARRLLASITEGESGGDGRR